jgi:hypothetical protein
LRLKPAGGLSASDISWATSVYRPLPGQREAELSPGQSVPLNISAGEQRDFLVFPQETRFYEFKTFGTSDSVMALFEYAGGELRYRTCCNDSGNDINAYFRFKLIKGHKYMPRLPLYYSDRPGQTAVMTWQREGARPFSGAAAARIWRNCLTDRRQTATILP